MYVVGVRSPIARRFWPKTVSVLRGILTSACTFETLILKIKGMN